MTQRSDRHWIFIGIRTGSHNNMFRLDLLLWMLIYLRWGQAYFSPIGAYELCYHCMKNELDRCCRGQNWTWCQETPSTLQIGNFHAELYPLFPDSGMNYWDSSTYLGSQALHIVR